MRRIKIVVLVLFLAQTAFAQSGSKPDVWNTLLNDVDVKFVFSVKYKTFVSKPTFGSKCKALNGKVVTVQGFYLPCDPESNIFIVSHNPSKMCFFCSGAGIETIVEINPQADEIGYFKDLRTDDFFEVKGKLELNAEDFDHLIYVLNGAEFIRIVKQ